MEKEFQHTIPKFVLKNFVYGQGIWICDKEKGILNKTFSVNKTKAKVNYGSINYYGHDKIQDLTTEQTISPENNIRVEDFLSRYVENGVAPIFQKIISNKKLRLTSDELRKIVDYTLIQHLRSIKTKHDLDSFQRTKMYSEISCNLPKNLKEKLKEKYSGNNQKTLLILEESKTNFLLTLKWKKIKISLLVGKKEQPFLLPDSGLIFSIIEKKYVCYLPIHPELCLYLYDENLGNLKYQSYDDLTEMTYASAHKEIYSNNRKILEKLHKEIKKKKITRNVDGTCEIN